MVDITSDEIWSEKSDEKKVNKMSFENRIVAIGLVLFGTCIIINSVLIYTFFKLLNQL